MRKRTNRRVYQLLDPIAHASYQASKLTIPEWNTQMAPVLASIERLASGDWDRENWQNLFETLNRIESILKLNRVSDQGLISRAQDAYSAALLRQQTLGAKAFKHDELQTIREVGEVYGDLLREVTHAQFKRARDHTIANLDRIIKQKAGRQVAGVIIE